MNIGSRAPAYPPFIVALRERGPTAIHDRRPRSGRGSDRFPDPEITFLTRPSSLSVYTVAGLPRSVCISLGAHAGEARGRLAGHGISVLHDR
jgi:hypothetical protein